MIAVLAHDVRAARYGGGEEWPPCAGAAFDQAVRLEPLQDLPRARGDAEHLVDPGGASVGRGCVSACSRRSGTRGNRSSPGTRWSVPCAIADRCELLGNATHVRAAGVRCVYPAALGAFFHAVERLLRPPDGGGERESLAWRSLSGGELFFCCVRLRMRSCAPRTPRPRVPLALGGGRVPRRRRRQRGRTGARRRHREDLPGADAHPRIVGGHDPVHAARRDALRLGRRADALPLRLPHRRAADKPARLEDSDVDWQFFLRDDGPRISLAPLSSWRLSSGSCGPAVRARVRFGSGRASRSPRPSRLVAACSSRRRSRGCFASSGGFFLQVFGVTRLARRAVAQVVDSLATLFRLRRAAQARSKGSSSTCSGARVSRRCCWRSASA